MVVMEPLRHNGRVPRKLVHRGTDRLILVVNQSLGYQDIKDLVLHLVTRTRRDFAIRANRLEPHFVMEAKAVQPFVALPSQEGGVVDLIGGHQPT